MKRLMQAAIIIVSIIVLIGAAVVVQHVEPAQKKPDFQPFVFADTLAGRPYDLDSLKEIIGDNKKLPEGYELAAALALSAYPQLRDVKIDMLLTQHGAPMETTMKVSSLLGARKGRRYLVLLNDAPESHFDPILLRSLPFDAQVGILAHELGHVVYYHDLNILQLGKWGLKYLRDDEFRAIHERSTDLMPVYHGMGSQIYQYAYYVRKDSSCIELYMNGKGWLDKYYMTDVELLEAIVK